MSDVTVENAIQAWVVAASGLAADHVIWEGQGGDRPSIPFITLEWTTEAPVGMPWTDVADNPLTVADDDIEAVNTVDDELTLTAHGLLTGDGPIRFTTTGTLPGGLVVDTDYWVIKVDADTIKVASTFLLSLAGTPVDLTSSGTGTNTLVDTSETVRQGIEITHTAREQSFNTLTIQCFAEDTVGASRAGAILRDVRMKSRLPTSYDALRAAGVGLARFTPVNIISGVIGTTQWEPRAVLTCFFHLATEATENSTFIETAEVTREVT